LIAVSPVNPKHIFGGVTCDFVANGNGMNQADRGFFSIDGGSSWRTITFPENELYGSGDPQTAFGRTGTAYFMSLMRRSATEQGELHLGFFRSADSGFHWDGPVYIGPGDHEMVVVDQGNGAYAGRVYVGMLTGFKTRGHSHLDYHISVYRSLDDGKSWLGPVDVENNHADTAIGRQVYNLLLFRDGGLFVPIVNFGATAGVSNDNYGRIMYSTSSDGGVTFTTAKTLETVNHQQLIQRMDNPMFAIDRTDGPHADRIYLVFNDKYPAGDSSTYHAAGTRLMLSYSDDRGKVWSDPKVIDPGTAGVGDQFSAMLAVNNEGTLAITWYDTRDTPAGGPGPILHRYVTASIDGGATFLPPRPVSTVGTDYYTMDRASIGARAGWGSPGFDVTGGATRGTGAGDYWSFAASPDGSFQAAWTDGRVGSFQMWTAKIRVDRGETKPPAPELVEADVTADLGSQSDPIKVNADGTVEVPVRLRNTSSHVIYGPFTVGVSSIHGTLLNSLNHMSDSTATMDYSKALGDFESLGPGEVTEAVVWRFKIDKPGDHPSASLKVRARVAK
jgi:hypothetical protein